MTQENLMLLSQDPERNRENHDPTAKNSRVLCSLRLNRSQPCFRGDIHSNFAGVDDVIAFNRDGELVLYGGSLYTGEAQVSLSDHSEKTAWYASATGSRSNYGLATPVAAIDHDATNSESGFVSLLHSHTPKGQLRANAQFPT
jgi:hypothetical protein